MHYVSWFAKTEFRRNLQENVKHEARHTCNLFSTADLMSPVLLYVKLCHLFDNC